MKLLVNASCKILALPDESVTSEHSLLLSGSAAVLLQNLLAVSI